MNNLLQQFENACLEFQQPNTRQQAEHILQKFQNQTNPYDFCRLVLGFSTTL